MSVRPVVEWPDPVMILGVWLRSQMPGTNVVLGTDPTFGTAKPSAHMGLPLVLLEPVPGGFTDLYRLVSQDQVDVSCFGANVRDARALARDAHETICRMIGERTSEGVIDDVTVSLNPGALKYSNPGVYRFVASYELTVRPV